MIAGDIIVLKPHEKTPLSALYMARLFEEAKVPPGVIRRRASWRHNGERTELPSSTSGSVVAMLHEVKSTLAT